MKAARMHTRAGPEALVYEDAPTPEIGSGEVLVRVRAAGITPTEFTWSSTFTTKDKKSRLPIIPAFEVAGAVEKTGPTVSDLAEGDAVYGLLDFWRDGAAAEHVAVRAADLAPKPESLSFTHAAAIPLSGLTAWQSLFDYAKLNKGDTVLIHGAGGGVGTFAVQLARWRGARVFATCSAEKAGLVRSLGADRVIDYSSVKFQEELSDLDVVLDTVGGEVLDNSWSVLRRGGSLVTIVGDAPDETAAKYGVKGFSILVEPNRNELVELARLVDAGEVKPVVDSVFPLPRAREAYESGLSGHSRGKLVLKVGNEGE
ncbi:MAG: NADP-dependent oxidoreductase [Nitrososphaerota archaeon]|nr:NADP-dependent oxidoreductase [Nitrososphaerota archaeon]